MELFTLTALNDAEHHLSVLYNEIMRQFQASQHFEQKIMFYTDDAHLYCSALPVKYKHKRDGETLYKHVSVGIAHYVVGELEKDMIRRIIKHKHHIYDEQHIMKIKQYCVDVMNNFSIDGLDVGEEARIHYLANQFATYLKEHDMLNVEGFVQFRLPAYKENLRNVVEYAVEQFIMDQQYEEFISLLQYFVYVQDRKAKEVHIIHKDGNDFLILDEHHRPIEKEKTDDFVIEMIDKDLNYEDMIISALISISPETIFIHTRSKELQIIKTIQHIFENRTHVCESCALCHPMFDQFSLDR